MALAACSAQTVSTDDIPSDLPIWKASVDLTLGASDNGAPALIEPHALGADEDGSILVMDIRLLELHRYDSTGRWTERVIRPGEGPGELRTQPLAFGRMEGGVWFWEAPTGRVHSVYFDGRVPQVAATELRLISGAEGVTSIEMLARDGRSEYLVEAISTTLNSSTLRRTSRVVVYRTSPVGADTIVEFARTAEDVVLDGGLTTIRMPGPMYYPLVLHNPADREVVVARRPAADEGVIDIQVVTESGTPVRRRRFRVDVPRLTRERRARMEEILHRSATLGGARSVNLPLQRELSRLVDEFPDWLPAFAEGAIGPDGSLWLRRDGINIDGWQEWLVLDRDLEPVGRAHVPDNAEALTFHEDGAWWAVMDRWLEKPYVARMRFTGLEAPQPPSSRLTRPEIGTGLGHPP